MFLKNIVILTACQKENDSGILKGQNLMLITEVAYWVYKATVATSLDSIKSQEFGNLSCPGCGFGLLNIGYVSATHAH